MEANSKQYKKTNSRACQKVVNATERRDDKGKRVQSASGTLKQDGHMGLTS